jgi:hypothetical protein
VSQNVASTATISSRGGRQIITTGALNANIRRFRSLAPYVTLGAGITSTLSDGPQAELAGNYRFALPQFPVVDERDIVTVRADTARMLFTGVIGGGVRYDLSRAWAYAWTFGIT